MIRDNMWIEDIAAYYADLKLNQIKEEDEPVHSWYRFVLSFTTLGPRVHQEIRPTNRHCSGPVLWNRNYSSGVQETWAESVGMMLTPCVFRVKNESELARIAWA